MYIQQESDLKLLQLPDVALTLADHLPHLVLVFVLLMQPLGLLPLVLLLRKLKDGQKTLTDTTADGSQVVFFFFFSGGGVESTLPV